ncbi:class I SAM-dependent methyltransferase, partial [Glutamicibacter creatinolyticus]
MGEQYAARLVDLYDADNPDGPDHDYYRELAARHAASSILDLGCGTGILTVTFAGPGRQVTGV